MDLDHAYGFRASFQVVPEGRYLVPLGYWNEIRSRRFEFNIHDLSHNGYLFHDKRQFERRAKLINGYARTYGLGIPRWWHVSQSRLVRFLRIFL